MQDNVSVLVATLMAVIIIVLFPIYNIATRQDSIANNMVVRATTNFVDEARNKGYIDKEDYGTFLNELSKSGNTYKVQMEVYKPILVQVASAGEIQYEEKYKIDYTDTILADMDDENKFKDEGSIKKSDVYYLDNGYKFYVRVKNTNVTQAQILLDKLFSGKQNERIVVNYGGVVFSNEWEQGDRAETISPNITLSRPLNYNLEEFKYGYVTSVYDELTGEHNSIYGIKVALSDKNENSKKILFRLKYTGVDAIAGLEKLDDTEQQEGREGHIKKYIAFEGFTVADEDITVSEIYKKENGSKYDYEYLITLTNIQYDFTNVTFVNGRLKIQSNSAVTKAGALGEVNSVEFIIFYEDKITPYIIPDGFVKSIYPGETEIADGMVIYEATKSDLEGKTNDEAMTTYNQYVWIPVNNIDDFKKWDFGSASGITGTALNNLRDYNAARIWEKEHYDALKESVEKYGGFYIARYEAKYSNDGTGKPRSVKNATSWVNIAFKLAGYADLKEAPGAETTARKAYEGSHSVVSTLMYGIQWDAVMKFIDTNHTNFSTTHCTNPDDSFNNIYEIAKEPYEWTMEIDSSGKRVDRGTSYGSLLPSDRTNPLDETTAQSTLGFRVALYLK